MPSFKGKEDLFINNIIYIYIIIIYLIFLPYGMALASLAQGQSLPSVHRGHHPFLIGKNCRVTREAFSLSFQRFFLTPNRAIRATHFQRFMFYRLPQPFLRSRPFNTQPLNPRPRPRVTLPNPPGKSHGHRTMFTPILKLNHFCHNSQPFFFAARRIVSFSDTTPNRYFIFSNSNPNLCLVRLTLNV